jgi:hypothetical protein
VEALHERDQGWESHGHMTQEASLPFKVLMLQLGSIVRLKSIEELINHLGPLIPLSLADSLRDPLWGDLEKWHQPRCLAFEKEDVSCTPRPGCPNTGGVKG